MWEWYQSLSSRRRIDQGVKQHLSPQDLWMFFHLIGERPQRWEIDLIMRLDYLDLSGGGEK